MHDGDFGEGCQDHRSSAMAIVYPRHACTHRIQKVWHKSTPEGLVFEKDHRCQPYHAVVLLGFRQSGRIRISCRGHGTQVG